MLTRLKRFEEKLDKVGIDGFLVTGQNNIYYMTGFWGTSATVFISKTRCLFVTDARYTLIVKQSVQGFDIIESRDPLQRLPRLSKQISWKELALIVKCLLPTIKICKRYLQVIICKPKPTSWKHCA